MLSKHIPQADADEMIILGAKLNGADLSLALKFRMDTALTYLKHNPNTQVIVSGGQGENEFIPTIFTSYVPKCSPSGKG